MGLLKRIFKKTHILEKEEGELSKNKGSDPKMVISKSNKAVTNIPDYIDHLLVAREVIEKVASEEFINKLGCDETTKRFKMELVYFSLWLVTISTPPDNKKIKDRLHDAFTRKVYGVGISSAGPILEQIEKRYENYYAALNAWQKNPQSGHIVGAVITEIIKNQNAEFSVHNSLPAVSDIDALNAFEIFTTLFKHTLKIVAEINKKHNISGKRT